MCLWNKRRKVWHAHSFRCKKCRLVASIDGFSFWSFTFLVFPICHSRCVCKLILLKNIAHIWPIDSLSWFLKEVLQNNALQCILRGHIDGIQPGYCQNATPTLMYFRLHVCCLLHRQMCFFLHDLCALLPITRLTSPGKRCSKHWNAPV